MSRSRSLLFRPRKAVTESYTGLMTPRTRVDVFSTFGATRRTTTLVFRTFKLNLTRKSQPIKYCLSSHEQAALAETYKNTKNVINTFSSVRATRRMTMYLFCENKRPTFFPLFTLTTSQSMFSSFCTAQERFQQTHLFQSAAFHKCKSYLLCLEFADKILIFAVLERRLLQ